MNVIRIENPSEILLPKDVIEKLGLKKGDTMVVRIEDNKLILERPVGSPVDESFGTWTVGSSGPEYVNGLRNEWEERLTDLLKDD